jgi:hypothetical protein
MLQRIGNSLIGSFFFGIVFPHKNASAIKTKKQKGFILKKYVQGICSRGLEKVGMIFLFKDRSFEERGESETPLSLITGLWVEMSLG